MMFITLIMATMTITVQINKFIEMATMTSTGKINKVIENYPFNHKSKFTNTNDFKITIIIKIYTS